MGSTYLGDLSPEEVGLDRTGQLLTWPTATEHLCRLGLDEAEGRLQST